MSSLPPLEGKLPRASPPGPAQPFWRDRVLRSTVLVAGVLMAYQLVVTMLHPAWVGSEIDWFRAALAWPELAMVILVSFWLTHAR